MRERSRSAFGKLHCRGGVRVQCPRRAVRCRRYWGQRAAIRRACIPKWCVQRKRTVGDAPPCFLGGIGFAWGRDPEPLQSLKDHARSRTRSLCRQSQHQPVLHAAAVVVDFVRRKAIVDHRVHRARTLRAGRTIAKRHDFLSGVAVPAGR